MFTHKKYAIKYTSGKLVVSGEKLELKQYYTPINCDTRDYEIKKDKNSGNEKRLDNLLRARQNVRQIVWCNVTPHTKFLTLTTSDIVLDKKIFKRRLTTFIQAMKREGYKLRYLGVLERQVERGKKEGNIGSIHAHLIIFNDEFIPFEIINKHWNGMTDIKVLNGLKYDNNEKIRDIGAYVCKYITKESCQEWGSQSFFCSNGLKRPYSIQQIVYKNELGEYLCTDTNNKFAIDSMLSNCQYIYGDRIPIEYDLGGVHCQYITYEQYTKSEVMKNA